MERDDNMQQKQEQEEQQQWLEVQQKQISAMSDEEFFQCIGNIEQEVAKYL